MIKISHVSEGLTAAIKRNMPVDEVKAEQIEYGIYMTISEVIKIAAIIIISKLVGVLNYSIVAILIFGVHRGFIGGVHAKTHWGCFISYSIIIFGTIYTSLFLNVDIFILCALLYPICMIIAYKYAPADILNKPVVSKKQRRYLRTGGFAFLTLCFVSSLFLTQPYANITIIITFVECVTMLPIVYKLTKNEYGRREAE